MVTIKVEPEDIWEYAMENLDKIRFTSVEVARNDEISIRLEAEYNLEFISLTAVMDNEEMDMVIVGEDFSDDTPEKFYKKWLETDAVYGLFDDEDDGIYEYPSLIENELIEEREEELDEAIEAFISSITEDEVFVEEIKEELLEFMSKYCSIYRPMYVESDDKIIYTEFPYEEFDFS